MAVTNNNFVIENYGHPNIKGCCYNFNLVPRQELFSHLFSLVSNTKDEVVIDTVFKQEVFPPMVFCICKKNLEKKLRKQYEEIDKFCKVKNGKVFGLSEKLVVISDIFNNNEKLSIIEKSDVLKNILKNDNELNKFNYLIISDQSKYLQSDKCIMRLSFKIYQNDDISTYSQLNNYFIENIDKVSIDGFIKDKNMKIRKMIIEEEEKKLQMKKREEIMEKNQEKKEKEFANMSLEERRKYEERERNRQVKRKQIKVKMG